MGTVVEGEELTIHHSEEALAAMNEWCVVNHAHSGLTQAVRDSEMGLAEAEARTLEFIRRHVPDPGTAPFAGNSVHVDVGFLKRYMPAVAAHAHYRIVDVSSVGEVARRWFPRRSFRHAPHKAGRHTAMSDIRESIEQLRWYKHNIFTCKK